MELICSVSLIAIGILEDEDDSSSENMPGQSFLLALTPSRQMPTEKMALKAGENRLMKSYFDI